MLDAPQHDWSFYDAHCRPSDDAWLRSLSAQERFSLYADMFNVVWSSRSSPHAGNWNRLDQWAWNEKLATRRRLVAAYAKLDDRRRERTTSTDAD